MDGNKATFNDPAHLRSTNIISVKKVDLALFVDLGRSL
jgi:hypothetical protein